MQHLESIDFLNKVIYTKRGIKKAMDQASKRSILKNNYNKGYLDALNDDLKCLNELKVLLETEQDQKFMVKLDSIRKQAV